MEVRQLTAFMFTADAIKANVRAGRWRAIAPRVYATFTGPLPRESRIAAALLYAGPMAVLSHCTAAEEWGMRPPSSGPVHVTVPYNCSAISQPPLVMVHRSRAFRHIAVDGRPPLTNRADTVIDLAVAEPTPRDAQRTITEMVTGRRVAAAQLRERLFERPPWRYKQPILEAVDRLETGVQSMLEERYAVETEAAHGLPEARRQQPVLVDDKTLVEDAVYDHLGIPLTVRLDGRTHLEPDVAYRDRRRDNAAELAGRSRLVFGWRELSESPCQVADEVAHVLHEYGWHGPLRRCPKCPGQDP
ncbi:hypothetical protein [Pseudonocardia acaciae]|uniref:hypothetical protein n=1 Tax=Pseudonocardia acaciae TaxID=551276 RepID=UPI001FDF4C70|nr:hypothetical protein [Pseudonocardia acaciae]